MTLTEYANLRGISTQAVYKRLKNRHIDPSQLKSEKTSQLSDAGLRILDSIFDNQDNKPIKSDNKLIDELVSENEHLKQQIAAYKDMAEREKARADGLQEALYREQHNLELQLLALSSPQSTPQPKKRFRLPWQRKDKE